jgi:hypothetical protein
MGDGRREIKRRTLAAKAFALLLILGSVHFQCGELLGDEEETGVEKMMRTTNDNTAVRGCEKS